ncbi:MAG: dockerin type I domain-containing protein [bacterium]
MFLKISAKNFFVLFAIFFLGLAGFAFADEFTATSYKILDPVIAPGSFSSSTSYNLHSVISQISIGTSSASATGFGLSSGFLYFPTATVFSVLPTAGNGQVDLSWSASTGYLGWTVSGYDVGQSTVSGGPYTYTDVGNVWASTRSGLTNGTPYYFVVRAQDAFGNAISTSSQVSATPVAPSAACGDGTCNGSETCSNCPSDCGQCGGGGGGGGGGTPVPTGTKVILQGKAYPSSDITVLKDGQISAIIKADAQANFKAEISLASGGIYTFGLWAEDSAGRRSITFSFTTNVTSGMTTTVGGIFLPPTIDLSKTALQKGESLDILGQTAPQSEITISVNSAGEIIKTAKAGTDGVWFYTFDTSPLEEGSHNTRAKSASPDGLLSTFSQTLTFQLGKTTTGCPRSPDINNDKRVNLIDFSILLYNWGKPKNVASDLNCDGKVTLTDFSIMLYWWTG